jgi:hypothetical protein
MFLPWATDRESQFNSEQKTADTQGTDGSTKNNQPNN